LLPVKCPICSRVIAIITPVKDGKGLYTTILQLEWHVRNPLTTHLKKHGLDNMNLHEVLMEMTKPRER